MCTIKAFFILCSSTWGHTVRNANRFISITVGGSVSAQTISYSHFLFSLLFRFIYVCELITLIYTQDVKNITANTIRERQGDSHVTASPLHHFQTIRIISRFRTSLSPCKSRDPRLQMALFTYRNNSGVESFFFSREPYNRVNWMLNRE